MPQLVKGGKHTFGWSCVGKAGQIALPPAAIKEYGFHEDDKLYMIQGSRTSGGFGLASRHSLKKSPLLTIFNEHQELKEFSVPEGTVFISKGKLFSWIQMKMGCITVPFRTLERYEIKIGDKLLTVRGSGLALGFIVKGPIVAEAVKHPELDVFTV